MSDSVREGMPLVVLHLGWFIHQHKLQESKAFFSYATCHLVLVIAVREGEG